MKKLLLFFIIPFLSFGQCEDESACNYGMTAEDFIAGAFTGECEYVGDYCFSEELFFPSPNQFCSGSMGKYSSWNENCECVVIEHHPDCFSENNLCPIASHNTPMISVEVPDSIYSIFYDSCWPSGIGELSLICLEPGDSCLFGYTKNMYSVWDVIIFEDIPETVFHADMVANNSTIYQNIFPVSILEGDFNNFPFDWLVVNNFNSVMNENCECECVSGDYFYYNYGSFDLSTMSGFEPMQFLYYDCGDDAGFNEQFNKKNLITTVDILGRETTNNKGFQLHIYDDGSIEKKYHLN